MRIIRRQVVTIAGLIDAIQADMEADERSISAICAEAGFGYQNWRRICNSKDPSMDEETFRSLERALGKNYGVKFE